MTLALCVAGLGISALAGGGEPPLLFLNHFYVVVDAATYRAMQESAFLTRELAPFEKRTTARNDQTYTGIYWYGRRTYFEVFEPDAQGPVGASGLAFGTEAAGGGEAVRRRWAGALGGADRGLVTRKTDTAEVPWFDMVYAKTAPGTLRTWLMEYHHDFLARWYPDLTSARSITRADVLDRYVARIGQGARRGEFLLEDVLALELTLDTGERDALVRQVRASGWTSRDTVGAVVCEGPEGVSLRVTPTAGGANGITTVELSLQREARGEHRFGAAVLTLDGRRARFRLSGAPDR